MISLAPRVTKVAIAAIQSPSRIILPTLPNVLEFPLKRLTPKENKNKKGIRINKNTERAPNTLGIKSKPRKSKGHSTVPKNNKTIPVVSIVMMVEIEIIKNKIPNILRITFGIALSVSSKK